MERGHECELLLCIAPPPEAATSVLAGVGTFLGGPAYALLRHEFWRRRIERLMPQARTQSVGRVIVSLGGSSQLELLKVILRGLASLSPPLRVTVIGPDTSATTDSLDSDSPLAVEAIAASSDMSGLLAEASLAIGACGGSAWERAALGVPSIALPIVDNQRYVAETLRQAGAALVLPTPCEITAADIAAAAGKLLNDPEFAAITAQHAESLVDGLGTRRVLLHVDPERTADGQPVALRPATETDGMMMYDWQRAPETRRYANNPNPPTLDEHTNWLSERLKDPCYILSVVSCGGADAGVVRVDLGEHRGRSAGVVSVYLAPGLSGRGIGTAALRAVRRLIPDIPLDAEIDEKNAASRAAFAKAGYRQVDTRWYTTCDG